MQSQSKTSQKAIVSDIAIFVLKRDVKLQPTNQPESEYKHSLTVRVRRYVVIATKPLHRLQIRRTVHNYRALPTIPKLRPGPCSSVGMRRGTDR